MGNNELLHTKESIIIATIEVIDEFGIHGLSTREVAKRVGISEAAIYKHYKTKNVLILAVLDHFSHYDLDIIQSIRSRNLKPIDAIISFIDTYATYYDNYPAITALTQNYDAFRNDPELSDKIYNILLLRTNFIKDLLKQAQIEGDISNEIDSDSLAITILGTVREWYLHWRMSNYSSSINERLISSIKMLLDTLIKKK